MDTTQARVADYAGGEVVTIGADDSTTRPWTTMIKAGVRRLPANDGHDLVGVVGQTDAARTSSEDRGGDRARRSWIPDAS